MQRNKLPGLPKKPEETCREKRDKKKLIELLHKYCHSGLTVNDEYGTKFVIIREAATGNEKQ